MPFRDETKFYSRRYLYTIYRKIFLIADGNKRSLYYFLGARVSRERLHFNGIIQFGAIIVHLCSVASRIIFEGVVYSRKRERKITPKAWKESPIEWSRNCPGTVLLALVCYRWYAILPNDVCTFTCARFPLLVNCFYLPEYSLLVDNVWIKWPRREIRLYSCKIWNCYGRDAFFERI